MRREIFTSEHDEFRELARTFITKEVEPHHARWEDNGIVDREAWLAAGRVGLLGMAAPEEYGGGGAPDFRFNAVLVEEMVRAGASGLGLSLHNDIILPYLLALATEEQKRRWLPGFCSGELISAIAMTEPGTGSDLQNIATTAVRDGDDYVLNGQKTFISNGILSDLVIVAAKTDPAAGAHGVSLLVVERDMPGFTRGRNLDKIGQKAQDTAELFFDDVRVPATNLLGEEGKGFVYLMQNLPQERLSIAVAAVAAAERVLEATKKYCQDREAFGRPIAKFQNTRFVLAELATEVTIARVFVDRCISEHQRGELQIQEAAMAKWWTTELQTKVADRCLQLHGGYGYMTEYPVAKAFLDGRVQTIYGGTTEIMKEIIGRSMGL
ncbi:alkylation response protein AidB-like acyl-CoA dehydrogenase [Crossiella equi]|uniref:Acyl-[acyl-carrier-protein] dehydrogenase MbtN n=1 Tax=Crossiella equi TaxID=130796 RepID=A0ABS5AJD0_9PSEU|nr:acyl-CoA dehydrogenase family protein [Crossiella equi]MBP2476496.1 alkylation response protein AidB-like acyl-CoA dehydrogenase [Crossiella equi]